MRHFSSSGSLAIFTDNTKIQKKPDARCAQYRHIFTCRISDSHWTISLKYNKHNWIWPTTNLMGIRSVQKFFSSKREIKRRNERSFQNWADSQNFVYCNFFFTVITIYNTKTLFLSWLVRCCDELEVRWSKSRHHVRK
jgi:hypothetical protein